jgi:cystathionine beta-lyase/cystathionine gamma-synthase
MTQRFTRLDTKLVHTGEPRPGVLGAAVLPVFQSAMFEYGGETSYHDLKYIRLNNTPNHRALHEKLAGLENAEDALVAASGMAAISTALLSVLSAGDHLLAQKVLYGGTHDLLTKDFKAFGLSYDFIDASAPETWKAKLRPNTRAIYVEAMSNPLLEVCELKAAAAFARENGLVSLIDSTFASPVNFRPIEHGFDLSLHSGTKYLNGHSDIVCGAVIGGKALIEKVTHKLNHLGGALDPHAAFLLHRGLKTLALRVRHQNESALRVARFLAGHAAVAKVNHPGLEGHPGHARAKAWFDGFGGMLSFELRGGVEAARRFIARVAIPLVAPSLGGPETLVTLPATTSHSGMDPVERRALGISDGLVRVSIGFEAVEDLVADFEQALRA